MNNLTCWEHFFCTILLVSFYIIHLNACMRVWVWVWVFVRLQCVHLLGGNLLDFFLIIIVQSHSLFFSTLCMHAWCMFFFLFLYSGWVYYCVFLSLNFLLIFSHHLRTVFISATLVDERTHTYTHTHRHKIHTSGKMTNEYTRQEKNTHTHRIVISYYAQTYTYRNNNNIMIEV